MSRNTKIILVAIAALVGLGLIWQQFNTASSEAEDQNGAPMVSVTVPVLMGAALDGEQVFNANCAVCHGENAAGRFGSGPPLVHKIYEPSHQAIWRSCLRPAKAFARTTGHLAICLRWMG